MAGFGETESAKILCAFVVPSKVLMYRTKGVVLILLSALAFASFAIWSRLIGTEAGIFYPSWIRSLLVALILTPIVLWRGEFIAFRRRDLGWLAVFLLCTSSTNFPIFYAFNHMDVGTAYLLSFVVTLLTMYVVGLLFLSERLTPVKILAFLVACVGLYLTFSFSIATFTFLAALAAVLQGIAVGGETAFSKRLSDRYTPLYLSAVGAYAGVVVTFIVGLVVGEPQFVTVPATFWAYEIIFTLVGIIGFWAVLEGLRHVEASIGGLIGLMEIVFGVLFGVLLYHEGLSTKVLLGGLCIIVAAALPNISWSRFTLSGSAKV